MRLDLRSGAEETLLRDIGPQARIGQPHYSPDGTLAVATRLDDTYPYRLVDVWSVSAGSPPRNLSRGLVAQLTSFAWALPAVVDAAQGP